MNLVEIEKVVAKIQTQLFRNSNSYSIGMLKSHFRGAGLQFKEHQIYNPGDDVRFIDWKLSAKSSHDHVKTFEEERNVEINVLIDLTNSLLIGNKEISKLQVALEITCLLYLLAKASNDLVKVIVFYDQIYTLPPKTGKEGIIQFVSFFEKLGVLSKDGKIQYTKDFIQSIDESKKIATLKSLIARNKEVVLLSDFSKIQNMEVINKLLYRFNFHCFKIVCELDYAQNLPFAMVGYESDDHQRKKRFFRFQSTAPQKMTESLHGRWKKLTVESRYLDEFVKEML